MLWLGVPTSRTRLDRVPRRTCERLPMSRLMHGATRRVWMPGASPGSLIVPTVYYKK
jgi:hypothetical protein